MTIQAGGKRLEGGWFGPGPEIAPTVVALHEGLGSLGLWRAFPEALAGRLGWGVFAYSRAGYGRSDSIELPRALHFMTTEAVEVLPEVLDAIGFERGILLGHSDGGSIAAIHAGTVRDPRVAALCLMAPHFFVEPISVVSIAAARDAFGNGKLREALARYHDDVEAAFYGWNGAWLDPGFRDWNITNVIAGIDVPVLAIQGRDDQYGTLAQIEVLADLLPSPPELLVLDDCGHAPHRDRETAVLDAVASLARRIEQA